MCWSHFLPKKKSTLAKNDSLQTFVLLQSKVIELQTSHKNALYWRTQEQQQQLFCFFKNEMKFKRHKAQTTYIENKTSECINIIHALCCYGSIILTVSAFFSEFFFFAECLFVFVQLKVARIVFIALFMYFVIYLQSRFKLDDY